MIPDRETRLGAGALLLVVLGAVLGHCAAGQPPPSHTEWKVIHVTHTVHDPGPTVEVPAPPPEACRTAIHIAHQVMSAGQQYERTAASLIDILGEVRQNAVTGDPNTANRITDELNQLTPRTISAAGILGSQTAPFFQAANACMKAYKEN